VKEATTTLTISAEDARATYSGLMFFSTPSATATTATVTLRATIQDITAVDPTSDANAGDIRNATVVFVDRGKPPPNTLCTASLTLISASDPKTATATCSFTGNVDSTGSAQYEVGTVISGYYSRNDANDDTVITVSQPLTNFITGGGYLTMTKSAGKYAADAPTRENFGFNAKFNKNGSNLQGHINLIFRRGGRVYQIKTTSFTSLTQQLGSGGNPPSAAQFAAKANLTDVTNPTAPISLEGGASFQMTMHDNGEPGSSDQIGFTLYSSSNQLLFSSLWDGTKTLEQILGGGNVVIH
jgi:hypothetical protein